MEGTGAGTGNTWTLSSTLLLLANRMLVMLAAAAASAAAAAVAAAAAAAKAVGGCCATNFLAGSDADADLLVMIELFTPRLAFFQAASGLTPPSPLPLYPGDRVGSALEGVPGQPLLPRLLPCDRPSPDVPFQPISRNRALPASHVRRLLRWEGQGRSGPVKGNVLDTAPNAPPPVPLSLWPFPLLLLLPPSPLLPPLLLLPLPLPCTQPASVTLAWAGESRTAATGPMSFAGEPATTV